MCLIGLYATNLSSDVSLVYLLSMVIGVYEQAETLEQKRKDSACEAQAESCRNRSKATSQLSGARPAC
jgi:hypothetical protein